MKGNHFPWNCRAGQNSMIIRVDGTLAPCFPMYTASYDWGVVGGHKFETKQLDHQKETCQTHCFSTLNHISRLVLQRSARDQVLLQATRPRIPGNEGSDVVAAASITAEFCLTPTENLLTRSAYMPVAEEIVQTDFEVEIQARIDAERARLRAEAGSGAHARVQEAGGADLHRRERD